MRQCIVCGKDISDRGLAATYCRECAQRKGRDDNHKRMTARIKDGASGRTTYGNKAYEILKREAHDKQGYKCIICGWHIPTALHGGCVVHHIIHVSDGGTESMDNVAVLCPNCHSLAHHDLISVAELHGLADAAIQARPTLEDIRRIVDDVLCPMAMYGS